MIEYDFTEDKYDNIDCFATAHTPISSIYSIEIKNRDIDYNKYADDGFILEKIKYDALMDAYNKSGYTPIYCNYFQNGIRITWNLTTIKNVENRWITKSCTRTTATNYGNRVDKKVILLYPKEGKVRRSQSSNNNLN